MMTLNDKIVNQNCQTIEQKFEELKNWIERFDRPEDIKFMQNELRQAIWSLSDLFGLKDQDLASIDMPGFTFDMLFDGYDMSLNEIYMCSKEITPYRIGFAAGQFLYSKVNPEIFFFEDFFLTEYIDTLGKSNPPPTQMIDFNISKAFVNLTTAISHYCGLYFNQDGCFESQCPSDLLGLLVSLPEDSDGYPSVNIQFNFHYKGMVIAEKLLNQYSPEIFKSITRLEIEEARPRLFYLTGIDLFPELDLKDAEYNR